ncbi:DUF2484 family protein [Psychromarinibacter sp. C21-152]|uniref:DUF2484 family protein n=1 Tax=Psychromarinibacter sediminicola TaxID=3033385 RepID=A0AAE3NNW0_9RHOB|nr:DUF2484 family protein [Psychromarinibacter sediminicola]MDF0599749.1 DUF2484 family protein [Psychromarinibacter sediminicola]
MSLPFILACLWCIAANFAGMLPSRRSHWPAAYTLIALGLPILAWLYLEDGPWFALVFLIAGMSILRWPVRFLFRWLNRTLGTKE